jgi:hypothetical protein
VVREGDSGGSADAPLSPLIADRRSGKGIDYPAPVHTNVTLKKAAVVYPESENLELLAAEDKAPYGKKPKR